MMRVMPSLLERQAELQMLGTAVERAGAGRGSAVLVLGEAGIGKTSLVHAFLAAAAGRARVLAGACEDLLTPRALGPLRDAARSAPGGPLAAALSPRADPDLVFAAVCDELAAPPSPAVLVVEDAHWADGATLDVLRYLGTRVQNLPAVLLMTYRDDALARDHPLRGVLGALGSRAATRLRLTPLTADAVRDMAASTNLDPGELFRLTGGNPFFVTEVLANPGDRRAADRRRRGAGPGAHAEPAGADGAGPAGGHTVRRRDRPAARAGRRPGAGGGGRARGRRGGTR